jgi:hypothetical protein
MAEWNNGILECWFLVVHSPTHDSIIPIPFRFHSSSFNSLCSLWLNSFQHYTNRDSMARGGQALMHSSHPLHLEESKITSMVLRLM